MNEVIIALKERRSVRKFTQDPVPEELIDQIVDAGIYAASGMGKQGVKVIVVTNKEMRDKLSAMNAAVMNKEGMDPFYGAPAVIVVLGDKSVPTEVYDGSLVLGNMMLAAYSLGIGSCWIHRAKQEFESPEGIAILKELGIEGEWEGIGHLILGWPLEETLPAAAPRKADRVVKVQ